MIEVELDKSEILIIGHNGNNFILFTRNVGSGTIEIYALLSNTPKLIFSRGTIMTESLSSFIVEENGCVFSNGYGRIIVNQNNECYFEKYKEPRYGIKIESNFFDLFHKCKAHKTKKHVFISSDWIYTDLNEVFSKLLNINLPKINTNDLIQFNPSNMQTEVFTFDDTITAYYSNPDESILAVAASNKLYLMDI